MKSIKKIAVTVMATLCFLSITGALLIADTVFTPIFESELLKQLKDKYIKHTEDFPQERIYLQVDKPLYEPGESIWFGAYLRDAATMKPSELSDIMYAELIGPKGNTEKKIALVVKGGRASGDFQLGDECAGGIYKIKAYTHYQCNEPDSLFFIKEITVQQMINQHLKMKLDFERKSYAGGDEVMAKLDVATNDNTPLFNHPLSFKASIDGENLIESQSSTGNDGSTYIRFLLPRKLKSNDGILNVMIEHDGITESISRSIPIVLNDIQLSFYPEGGDMITGVEGRIAFKALNEFGKPADVTGVIKDSRNRKVADFTSFHFGMGSFALTPEAGENYTAYLTSINTDKTFELPLALENGYSLNVKNEDNKVTTMTIYAPEAGEVNIVGRMREQLIYSNTVACTKGINTVTINKTSMPMGVAQFTLFDASVTAQCERLAFINKQTTLQIGVHTDKEKYLPREKVKLKITTKNELGAPCAASLSLCVTNDQLLSMADDKQGNIISELLLQPDLKGKIEEPAFYFSNHPKATQTLDLLLMTNGWRRFSWSKITEQGIAPFAFKPEKAEIKGTVISSNNGSPIAGAQVMAGNKLVRTNRDGKFLLKGIDISQYKKLIVKAEEYEQLEQSLLSYTEQYYQMEMKQRAIPVALHEVVVVEEAMQMREDAPMQMVEIADDNRIQAKANRIRNSPPSPVKKKTLAKNAEREIAKDEIKAVQKENKNEANGKELMAHDLDMDLKLERRDNRNKKPMPDTIALEAPAVAEFYRAREFPTVTYADTKTKVRDDFRSTLFFDGVLNTNELGIAEAEFFASDEITSFRAIAEGIGKNGLVGHSEKLFYTQLPFSVNATLPVELVTEDAVYIPVTFKNNSDKKLLVNVSIKTTDALTAFAPIINKVDLLAGESKTVHYGYMTGFTKGEFPITIQANGGGMEDVIEKKIKIVPKGFPVTESISNNEKYTSLRINTSAAVKGSVEVNVTAFPNVVSDILKGIEGIMREPGGCFEQTSMSSYPNVMVMDYLKTSGQQDEKMMASASAMIDRGYKKLISFETSQKGYEWFGSAPGHEALTAYGLMQFNDMQNVYGHVDKKMLDRTAAWLLSRKDGKGGYLRSDKAADSYGRANANVTNTYITYALTEANYQDLKKELDLAYENAINSKDAYITALAAIALINSKDNRANELLVALMENQNTDGSWTGKTQSITCSTDRALTIETTSLALLALLKSERKSIEKINLGASFLVKSRQGAGDFGNTQSTILALKALTAFATFGKRTHENGTIEFYVDGEKVTEKNYQAGVREAIVLSNLEKYVTGGSHLLEVRFKGCKNPLPSTIAVSYYSELPSSQNKCKIDLNTSLSEKTVKQGNTVRLTATIKNTTNEGLPSTMAVIGIPAGCSVQPWQLKEMFDKKLFDFYELKGNNLIAYYRQMKPSEKIELNFDLRAEIPGNYCANASTGYLYYTNEYRDWEKGLSLHIQK
ncbi:MAG: hypothetical protein IPO27_04085 [Bacteroidetes bacterium]|nr:hypothetical protein [Bacteroidota bacterium]